MHHMKGMHHMNDGGHDEQEIKLTGVIKLKQK